MGILEVIQTLNFFELGVLILLTLEVAQVYLLKNRLIQLRKNLQEIQRCLTDLSIDVAASTEERIKNEKVLAMMLSWVTDLDRKFKEQSK